MAILHAASRKGDARILGLGEDLIAIEAKYHNTCQHDYVRLEEKDKRQKSKTVENEIINKKKSPSTGNSIFQRVQRRVSCCWRNTG